MALALSAIVLLINHAGNTVLARVVEYAVTSKNVELSEASGDAIPVLDEFKPEKDKATVVAGGCDEHESQARSLFAAITRDPPKDPQAVIDFLSKCTRADRRKIIHKYRKIYNKNLVDEIETTFSADSNTTFAKLLSALTKKLPNYLADRLHDAVYPVAIDYKLLRLILTPPIGNAEIQAALQSYQKAYDSDLKQRLHEGTSDKMLRSILDLQLKERQSADIAVEDKIAWEDASRILRAKQSGKWLDENGNKFLNVLLTSSYPHLRRVMDYYEEFEEDDLDTEIADTFSFDVASAYSDILEYAENRGEWFAAIFSLAMWAKTTDVDTIILIVAWRAEIDLGNVKTGYSNTNEETLYHDINATVKDELARKVLLAIIGD